MRTFVAIGLIASVETIGPVGRRRQRALLSDARLWAGLAWLLWLLISPVALSATAAEDEVVYGYDALNRLTRVDYSNGASIVFHYDAAGNRSQVVHVPEPGAALLLGSGLLGLLVLRRFREGRLPNESGAAKKCILGILLETTGPGQRSFRAAAKWLQRGRSSGNSDEEAGGRKIDPHVCLRRRRA